LKNMRVSGKRHNSEGGRPTTYRQAKKKNKPVTVV